MKAEEERTQPKLPSVPQKKGDTRAPRGNREKQAARRQLTICETAIGKLEAEMARLDGEMEVHACDAGKLGELFSQKQQLEQQLEEQMLRWEELSLQLED